MPSSSNTSNEALERRLAGFIGVDEVKQKFREIARGTQEMRRLALHPRGKGHHAAYNLALLGQVATGKTTLAHVYAEMLHSLGVRSAQPRYIDVGKCYLTPTSTMLSAETLASRLEEARGGIAIVDNIEKIHRYSSDDYSRELCHVLAQPDAPIVILVGETAALERLLEVDDQRLDVVIPKAQRLEATGLSQDQAGLAVRQELGRLGFTTTARGEASILASIDRPGGATLMHVGASVTDVVRRHLAQGHSPQDPLDPGPAFGLEGEPANAELAKWVARYALTVPSEGLQQALSGDLRELASFVRATRHRGRLQRLTRHGSCDTLLLHGPPGTGKTSAALAVAHELQLPIFGLCAADLVDCHLGESCKKVRNAYARAREHARHTSRDVLVFLDEVDSLLSRRSHSQDTSRENGCIVTAFTEELIRVVDDPDAPRVITLAATNLLDILDPAIVSRFAMLVGMDLPGRSGLRDIFAHHLARCGTTLSEADLDRLADLATGFSGRDVVTSIKRAAMLADEATPEEESELTLDTDVIERAVRSVCAERTR